MCFFKRIFLPGIVSLLMLVSLSAQAQWEKKPYTEWNDKDAKKVLNDSPWGRTQTFSAPSTLFQGPITGSSGIGATRSGRPPDRPTDATHVMFRIRFLSAKPIRQAASRLIELQHKGEMSAEVASALKSFASGEFLEYIIIAVDCDSSDSGQNAQQARGLLQSRGTADLKGNTYLQIKGGNRLFIHEFQKPQRDGLGARFVFQRLVDGKPFITPESEEIQFVSQLSGTYKLDRRYKVKDMMYEGKLEY